MILDSNVLDGGCDIGPCPQDRPSIDFGFPLKVVVRDLDRSVYSEGGGE
jgi:hypothetical protein